MKGIQHSHTTKSSRVCSQQVVPPQKSRKRKTTTAALVVVCALGAGLRMPSCCRCPWKAQRLSQLGHRSLERVLSFQLPSSRFPFSPVPKIKLLLAVFGNGVKNKEKTSRRVSPTRLCPARRRSISLLHCRRDQPPDGAAPSMPT